MADVVKVYEVKGGRQHGYFSRPTIDAFVLEKETDKSYIVHKFGGRKVIPKGERASTNVTLAQEVAIELVHAELARVEEQRKKLLEVEGKSVMVYEIPATATPVGDIKL